MTLPRTSCPATTKSSPPLRPKQPGRSRGTRRSQATWSHRRDVHAGFAVETDDAPVGAMVVGVPLSPGTPLFNVGLLAVPIVTVTVAADAIGSSASSLPIPTGYTWNGQLALQSICLTPASCSDGLLAESNVLR